LEWMHSPSLVALMQKDSWGEANRTQNSSFGLSTNGISSGNWHPTG
jgi:hypothetical protein